MHDRGNPKNRLPHGSLWSRGLELAEAEIGRAPAPSGRWEGWSGTAEAAAPGLWTERETWAAQAA
jgi:hypothetical protein